MRVAEIVKDLPDMPDYLWKWAGRKGVKTVRHAWLLLEMTGTEGVNYNLACFAVLGYVKNRFW